MPLSNPNVHIVCINARKLFFMSNLNYGCPIWCTAPLQMHFMHLKQIHFICSCIPILFMYFHPSKPVTQLRHNTRTFKIPHFGIVYQDSKDRPCPLQCPTPSFAKVVSNFNGCSPLHIATIHELLSSIHLPPTVPRLWLQCWHLSPSTFVQLQLGHWLLLYLMVSAHTVHAQNSSNTLLAIKYGKTNKHWSLAYYLISHTLHKPYPPSRGTCFVLHCMSIPTRRDHPTPWMPGYAFATRISHFGSATIPTYSTCACPYPIPMSILCASMQESYSPCQIWTMDAPFGAQLHYKCISCIQNKFTLFVVAFQFSSCTFIHQSPWHNCVTILGHSKYDISV